MPRPSALLRRAAVGTGVEEVRQLEPRVDELADAVAENAALEVPLTALVAGLERSLVGILERRARLLGVATDAAVKQDIPPSPTDR